jgi:xylulokinase
MELTDPLYIGFDLSTQQLKALVATSELKVVQVAKFDFDTDSCGFAIKNGVITNEVEHEIFAPVSMWIQALDGVLRMLKDQGLDFSHVKGVSGAGQQHGSVYWSLDAEARLTPWRRTRHWRSNCTRHFRIRSVLTGKIRVRK